MFGFAAGPLRRWLRDGHPLLDPDHLLGHALLAYVEMLGRDRGRLADARGRLNECPLGAAALAGTSFPIDREATAAALGFDRPSANSIDAVSDRDFALEFLAAGAILAMHLSRLAEELVIWCAGGFGFVRLSDAFSTGSSIMPQKRNPDAAELVRGKAGRVIGSLNALLVMMKGLPMSYGKDMQEDKEPVFDAAETLSICLGASAGMICDMRPVPEAMRAATAAAYLAAFGRCITELGIAITKLFTRTRRDDAAPKGSAVAHAQ